MISYYLLLNGYKNYIFEPILMHQTVYGIIQ
jgi:hypothetical protein